MGIARGIFLSVAGRARVGRASRSVRVACRVAVVAFAVFVFAGVVVAPAFGASPWWSLTSTARPSYLAVGGASAGTVLEVSLSATGGDVLIGESEGTFFFAHAIIPYDASVQQFQEDVEKVMPGRTLSVTAGKSSGYTHAWVITFPHQAVVPPPGARTASPVFVSAVDAEYFGGAPLSCEAGATGCTGEAGVVEVQAGAATGRQIVLQAANVGDAPAEGGTSTISIADALPAGLEAVSIQADAGVSLSAPEGVGRVECSVKDLTCTFNGALPAYALIEIEINVIVKEGAGGENVVSVTGGVALGASVSRPVTVSGAATPFGVQDYEVRPEEEGGAPDTQAGSHPFQVTGVLAVDQTADGEPAGGLVKDLAGQLPAGLIGNPTVLPRCTLAQFLPINNCPAQTVVGVVMVTVRAPLSFSGNPDQDPDDVGTFPAAIVNLEPAVGEPARFGFQTAAGQVYLDASVRTGGDYGVTLASSNITQTAGFLGFRLTFWGVPGDARHDGTRGEQCVGTAGSSGCEPLGESTPPPFLVMPTSCAAPLHTSIEGDSWAEPHPAGSRSSYPGQPMETLNGCNRLPFNPAIVVAPDVQQASAPSGLSTDVRVPQEGSLNGAGLASSNIKSINVKLPEGVGLNPSGADGLEACSEGLVGFTGFPELDPEVEPGVHTPGFTGVLPRPLEGGVNFCSSASKIATVKIRTPLLPDPLEGAVYLAEQNENPFGSLVAMYIVAEDPISGALVKLPGEVSLNQVTGQVEATFEDTPQLAFEEAELHFFGGERAPLSTPAHCGAYTTDATFTPWSGSEPVHSTSTFDITSGANGAPCPGAVLPFKPGLTGGTTSIQAGGFSPFTMTMSREDGSQNLQSIELHMPLGLSGTLAGVKLCGEEQANAGTCGAESLIGETVVSVGVGSEPFTVTGGKVYITGPYRGAPFGLSIVNPAKAGPFNLGQVIVRAKIEVDPLTAALTITTDTEGPYKIPTIIDGIPLQIKHVNVDINRPGFTFNPTNCSPLAITGTLGSSEGSTSSVSVPFQVTNCAVLAFKPKLEASTKAKWTRLDGTSFTVKLAYPAGPYDANIAKVKVELPEGLPSRLPTLQKACLASVFETNPAACPPASIIGHARATTPELPVALEGPAYFVSHGGEAFPSLVIVLQGYGVTVHLVGTTFISKQGVTSSTFKTVPDAPVGSFELTLPAGQYSALTGLGNLCKQKLVMPTEFVGQNGALINTDTKIAVTGCPKSAHKKHKAKKKPSSRGKRHKSAKGRRKR